jgi:type II secretory pathway pseudopilin PulG
MQRQRGATFMVMLVILIMGITAYLVSSLSSSAMRVKQDEVTANTLVQAKEALIGYAATYGDIHPGQMYGYLPLPDLGSSRNGTPDEGNAAGNFSGNHKNLTVIGRLPWRTLGLPPLQDSQGQCLWYAVSGSFQNNQTADVMNWDSLGHFDTYSSNGTALGTVSTTGANYAQRPVAIIFSTGAVLQGQNRQASGTDTVTTCGGNYDVRNYLDSFNPNTNINNIVNYFADPPHNNSADYAYGLTAASNGSQLSAAALLAPKNIIFGDVEVNIAGSIVKIANDKILTITTDDIFRPIIRRSDFAQQIGFLLDDPDFRLQVETGHVGKTVAISGAGTKGADNIDCTSIGIPVNREFCNNWKEMLLLTQLPSTSSITIDGSLTAAICNRVLIFGGQRFTGQVRATTTDKSSPANYLQAPNLAAFAVPVANSSNFSGLSAFVVNNPSADVLRCLP